MRNCNRVSIQRLTSNTASLWSINDKSQGIVKSKIVTNIQFYKYDTNDTLTHFGSLHLSHSAVVLHVTPFIIKIFSESVTNEVWNFETKTSRTINSFKSNEYHVPLLFLVDPNFCT